MSMGPFSAGEIARLFGVPAYVLGISSDFRYVLPNVWVCDETGVMILDEDMPDELRP